MKKEERRAPFDMVRQKAHQPAQGAKVKSAFIRYGSKDAVHRVSTTTSKDAVLLRLNDQDTEVKTQHTASHEVKTQHTASHKVKTQYTASHEVKTQYYCVSMTKKK